MPCCLSGPSIRLGWRWGEAHSLVRLPQYLPNRMNSSELCPALYRSIDTICPLLMERGFISSIRVVNAWIIVGFTPSIVSTICWGQFQLHCISGMSLPHLASTKKGLGGEVGPTLLAGYVSTIYPQVLPIQLEDQGFKSLYLFLRLAGVKGFEPGSYTHYAWVPLHEGSDSTTHSSHPP